MQVYRTWHVGVLCAGERLLQNPSGGGLRKNGVRMHAVIALAAGSCCLEPVLCCAVPCCQKTEESSDDSSSASEQGEASDSDDEEVERSAGKKSKKKSKAPARPKKGPRIGRGRALNTYCLTDSDLDNMKDVKTSYNHLFGGKSAAAARARLTACKLTVVSQAGRRWHPQDLSGPVICKACCACLS
jgi:hypothetical protein